MKPLRLHRDERGFTLIDLILVIIIVAIAIPPMLALFIQMVSGSTFGVTVSRANALASTLREEIQSKKWDESAPPPSLILGPETGESRAIFDDVDDFDGLDESPPRDSQGAILAGFTGFRQQVSVCYVTNTDFDTCIGGPTMYKQVTVTVTGPEGRATQLVTVIGSL
jgi:MSHA pilin protein MshD